MAIYVLAAGSCEIYRPSDFGREEWTPLEKSEGGNAWRDLVWDDASYCFSARSEDSPPLSIRLDNLEDVSVYLSTTGRNDGYHLVVQGRDFPPSHASSEDSKREPELHSRRCDFDLGNKEEETRRGLEEIRLIMLGMRQSCSQVNNLLTTRDKVPLAEIEELLERNGVLPEFVTSISMVEWFIRDKGIVGKIIGDAYMSAEALRREAASYPSDTGVDLRDVIGLSLKCKSCGRPMTVRKDRGTAECGYCKQNVLIPKTLLDLL